jgi:uncharacterized OB-fold protein
MDGGGIDKEHCFVVEARMALPNEYFAGRTGSRFLTALRDEKRILGVRCPSCGKTFVPPRETCERCWSKIGENWVEVGKEGEIVAHTVVRYEDRHLPKKPPYILALIRLKGADTPFPHIVEGVDPACVFPGMAVRAVFARVPVNTLMAIDHFGPL